MVYSRYADDIAISFPHFSTMEVLKEKMEKYLQELEEKEQEETTLSERIQNVMAKFSQETFTVTDKFELTYLQEKLKEMKDKIKNLSLSEGEQFAHIGILNGYKQKLKYSKWRI
jgi:CHAD domain-containing protein